MHTVAVIIPVHATPQNNRLIYFDQAMRSVTKQNLKNVNIVCLVTDDGSTDDVTGALSLYKSPGIRYLRRERKPNDLSTSSNALNLALDQCISRSKDVFTAAEADSLAAVAYIHSDDLLSKDSIERRFSGISSGFPFVYTDFAIFSDKLGLEYLKKANFGTNPETALTQHHASSFPHHTSMWEIGFLQKIKEFVENKYGQQGIFDPSITQREDNDASLSTLEAALKFGVRISYLPIVSYFYRINGDGIASNGTEPEKNFYESFVLNKHGIGQSKKSAIIANLKDDLPWSLGIYFPEKIKKFLRPVKEHTKPIILKAQNKELVKELSDLIA